MPTLILLPIIFLYSFQQEERRINKLKPLILISILHLFGRNGYYDMRKGKRPIAPADQEVIRTVVAECGAQQEVEFDDYEMDYQW